MTKNLDSLSPCTKWTISALAQILWWLFGTCITYYIYHILANYYAQIQPEYTATVETNTHIITAQHSINKREIKQGVLTENPCFRADWILNPVCNPNLATAITKAQEATTVTTSAPTATTVTTSAPTATTVTTSAQRLTTVTTSTTTEATVITNATAVITATTNATTEATVTTNATTTENITTYKENSNETIQEANIKHDAYNQLNNLVTQIFHICVTCCMFIFIICTISIILKKINSQKQKILTELRNSYINPLQPIEMNQIPCFPPPEETIDTNAIPIYNRTLPNSIQDQIHNYVHYNSEIAQRHKIQIHNSSEEATNSLDNISLEEETLKTTEIMD